MVFVLAVGIEQNLKGALQVGVIVQRGDDAAFLEIIATHNLGTQQLFYVSAKSVIFTVFPFSSFPSK